MNFEIICNRLHAPLLRGLFCVLALMCTRPAAAWTPPYSHMTLNGIATLAIQVDEIDKDLALYGLTAESIDARIRERVASEALRIIPFDASLRAPEAALLRVRVITNYDGHGFYHLSVKFEVRQKIPLGNAAGGFISQAVWTNARNGVMQASEVAKVTGLVDELVQSFLTEHRAQNAPVTTP
jgi:hypothetical protein